MESLIHLIKSESLSYGWKNGKVAEFIYNENAVWYQIIETTDDGKNYLVAPSERNLENCPVVALGLVAYLIRNWGRSETLIYKEFYELCLFEYINSENKKPGSFKRDLDAEHYIFHISEEEKRVSYSQKIYPFLTEPDSKSINEYVKSYFDFMKINYSEKSSEVKAKSVTPFSFYLKNIEKKDELIMLLKERYPNGKNKQCAVMLAVLYENEILDLPDKPLELYYAIAAEWKIEDFDRRGHEQILKKWWIQISKEWLQTHTPEYPSKVLTDIEYLKTKMKEIESK